MSFRTTLALFLLIAAGGAIVWFGPSLPELGRHHSTPIVDQGSQAALMELKPDALLRIRVHRADGDTVLERPEGGTWTLPGKWPVRSAEVGHLVDFLCSLRSRFQPESLRRGEPVLARCGLVATAASARPITVEIETRGSKHKLTFGESTDKSESNRFSRPTYVRVDDRSEVLRLAPGLLAVLDRPTEFYQQRRLFPSERVAKDSNSQEKSERLLAAGIAVVERRPAPPAAAPAAAGSSLLVHPQAHDGGYRLVNKDQTWEISAPVRDRLDPAPRETILAAIPDLWAERFVAVDVPAVAAAVATPAEGNLAAVATAAGWLSVTATPQANSWLQFKSGLSKPERVLSVTGKDGQSATLLIAGVSSVRTQHKTVPSPQPGTPPREETIREEFRYAQLQGNPQIFEIRADKLKDVFVDPAALRDPRLARFASADARRIEIDQQGRHTVIVKDKDRWKLEEPIKADADSGKVNELLDKLNGLEARKDDIRDVMDPAHPEKKAAELTPFGLDKPAAFIKVKVEEEGSGKEKTKEKKTHTLVFAVGKHDGKAKKLYVQVDDWPRVNAVDETLLPLVTRPALSYRGNRLFDFTTADLASLEIHKGEQKLTLLQEHNKWRLTAPFAAEADDAKAGQLASSLSGLEVIEYVSDAPATAELEAKYGLGKPALAVAMTFADKAKPAKTLQIGKARDGKPGFFARLGDSPGVFAVNNDIRNFLDRDALSYLPAELWKVAPEAVASVRIRKGAEPEYRLARVNGNWQVSGPFDAPALAESVQAALAQLTAPHAESYKSHDDKEPGKFGLDKPALTVSLTADGKEHSLLIGAPVGKDDRSRYAKLAGSTAVFVVGEPFFLAADKSALEWLDPVVIKLDPTRIDRIVNRTGAQSLTLEKKGAEWRAVAGPGAPFRADEETIGSVVAPWLSLKAERYAAYGSTTDLPRFGLDKPVNAVAVRMAAEAGKPAAEHSLELGKEVPDAPGARYARLDHGPGVLVLGTFVCKSLARDNLAYVDRTLIKLDPQTVSAFLRRGRGELEIAKDGDTWRLVKPVAEAADEKVMQEFLDQLGNLRASRIVAYPAKDPAAYGLDDSAVVVSIKLKGDKPTQLVLKLGKPVGENGERYAMAEGKPAVGVLPGKLAGRLAGGSLAFRDRNLAQFPDADKLRLERGQRRAVFARIDGSWKLTEPLLADADQEELDELLNSLARLRADEFVATGRAAGALASFGLEHPEVRWRVQAGDKDVLTLLVGKREKDGPRCYAKLGDRDLVFFLDPRLSARVLGEFRTRTVWSPTLDAAQVESLRYTSARGTYLLEKNDAGTWQVVGRPGLKIVPATVTETLDALAGLKLVRYAEDKDAAMQLYGLDPPQLTVEIGTRSGKRVLQLGRPEGESKRVYAHAADAGRTDVFILSESDAAKIDRDPAAFTRQPTASSKPKE